MAEERNSAELADRIPAFGRVDHLVFKVESVVVVAALIAMSIFVFVDVLYQLMVAIDQYHGQSDPKGWLIAGLLIVFVGAMGYASTSNVHFSLGKRIGISVAATLALVGFSVSLTQLESSTVYRVLSIGVGAVLVWHFQKTGSKPGLVVSLAATALFFWFSGGLPQGYSWAQSYSLLLLLWVGFLGASMAARQRRHLRVDLARKLLSPQKLPLFNALSYSAAAMFSGIIFYLSYIYIFDVQSTYIRPIWEFPGWVPAGLQETLQVWPPPEDAGLFERIMRVVLSPIESGEPPDWLKVLAIPVAFALITIRFGMHAFVFLRMALRKESFEEAVEVH